MDRSLLRLLIKQRYSTHEPVSHCVLFRRWFVWRQRRRVYIQHAPRDATKLLRQRSALSANGVA